MYFFATQIGGEKVDVLNITPAGAEPHDYEPTAQDIAQIEKSGVLSVNGHVEAWGNKIRDDLTNQNVDVVTAGEGLFTLKLTEGGNTSPDPHLWLDPKLAEKEAGKIEQAFLKKDPANAAYYQANLKYLNTKLEQLDAQYQKSLSTCQSKDIVTSHAAFGYLAKEYGLHQVAIAGLSPDAEPSGQQLADVAEFAKKNNVHYIFFESLISPKLSETVAHEIGAQTLVLDPIEGIPDDKIKQGENYFTVMESNLQNLQKALICTQ
jgi:zinc transport system substrate-binding protein